MPTVRVKRSKNAERESAARVGMYVLRVCLLREFGENEIGDVEEAYGKRLQAENEKAVRRWFWMQVFSTVSMSLRRPETARALLRGMRTRPSMIHSPISMGFFCLVAVMVFVPSKVNLGALQFAGLRFSPPSSRPMEHDLIFRFLTNQTDENH
jgi:hypothetical protein